MLIGNGRVCVQEGECGFVSVDDCASGLVQRSHHPNIWLTIHCCIHDALAVAMRSNDTEIVAEMMLVAWRICKLGGECADNVFIANRSLRPQHLESAIRLSQPFRVEATPRRFQKHLRLQIWARACARHMFEATQVLRQVLRIGLYLPVVRIDRQCIRDIHGTTESNKRARPHFRTGVCSSAGNMFVICSKSAFCSLTDTWQRTVLAT
jgi:hypothetical protein